MNTKAKLAVIKEHIKDHKEAYIAGSACLAVGLAAGATVGRPQLIQIVDAFNFKWKSPTNTMIINMLTRRGHPGYVIKCNETGEVFPSIARAAEANNMSSTAIRSVLNGSREDAKGLTFQKLGEATA